MLSPRKLGKTGLILHVFELIKRAVASSDWTGKGGRSGECGHHEFLDEIQYRQRNECPPRGTVVGRQGAGFGEPHC